MHKDDLLENIISHFLHIILLLLFIFLLLFILFILFNKLLLILLILLLLLLLLVIVEINIVNKSAIFFKYNSLEFKVELYIGFELVSILLIISIVHCFFLFICLFNIDSYLKSLEMEIQISENDICNIERISQLTQKTNQFNLTTKRYTETEIKNFMNSKTHNVFSFNVSDKFGKNGLTAVVIIELQDFENAKIDSFLMSCRIIGRNIEYFICEYVINFLKEKNIFLIHSDFHKTIKNSQVRDFFEKCGFKLIEHEDNKKKYLFDNYCNFPNPIKYINIRK